jgi:hypothetical protein
VFLRFLRLDGRDLTEPQAQRRTGFWAAEDRSQELLRSWLSPEQRKHYDISGCFDVVGSDSAKRYRICRGETFNVKEFDDFGYVIRSWCFTLDGLATGDVNLAQKIALETFLTQALALANRRGFPPLTSLEQRS